MKHSLRRIAALALAFAIAFVFLPDMGISSAYAAESTVKASTLKADSAVTFNSDTKLVLDKNISVKSINSDYDITVVNSGSTKHTLTVSGKTACLGGKNITIEGIKFIGKPVSDNASLNSTIKASGKITVKDSVVNISMGSDNGIIGNSAYIYDSNITMAVESNGIITDKGSLLIKDSKLVIDSHNKYSSHGLYTNGGNIFLTSVSGKIDIGEKFSGYAIMGGGDVTFSNCDNLELNGIGGTCCAVYDLIIKGNNYISDPSSSKISKAQNGVQYLSDKSGKELKHAVVSYRRLTDSSCTISVPNRVYTGSRITPVVVKWKGNKLAKDTSYTVTYTNNLNVGKAKVVIKGKGNYKGTVTKTFKILPKGTTLLAPQPVSKGAKIRWNAQKTRMSRTYITGYQIDIAKDSKFTKGKVTQKISGPSSVSTTVTGLTGGSTYYARIRTYKVVNGITYYSPWSAVKTFRTGA